MKLFIIQKIKINSLSAFDTVLIIKLLFNIYVISHNVQNGFLNKLNHYIVMNILIKKILNRHSSILNLKISYSQRLKISTK